VPPTTASYLQRVGRAGRATGTALIVAIINQQPHDLFFFVRLLEMLKGRLEPPGCWREASAVLVRQYLAYYKTPPDVVATGDDRVSRLCVNLKFLPFSVFSGVMAR